jgi:hypothetical protein
MERGDAKEPGPGKVRGRLAEHPGERLVEADQQGSIALAHELARLLDREHRLAGPGAAADLRPPDARELAQHVVLLFREADELLFALGDLGSEEGAQFRGRVEELLQEGDTLLPGGAELCALAGDEVEHPLDGGAGGGGAVRQQASVIEDEVRLDLGAEQSKVPAGALEVDVRERDCRPGDGLPPRWRVLEVAKFPQERVQVGAGLLEGGWVQLAIARPPAAMAVAGDLAALHLHGEDPALGMGDDEVRLAVPQAPVVCRPPDPPDVGVQAVLRRQRRAHALDHEPLRLRAGTLILGLQGRGVRRQSHPPHVGPTPRALPGSVPSRGGRGDREVSPG